MIGTSWMKVWWIAYNTKVFDCALPMPTFLVKDLAHCGEYYQGAITLSSRITTLELAKATLLHEMVHQWQELHNKPLDHGHEFKDWRELILAMTNFGDLMADQQLQERNTFNDAFAITPSDATVLRPTYGGLWVGGAGNVSVTTLDGSVVLFTAVPAGTRLPIVATRVRAATTATNILGMT